MNGNSQIIHHTYLASDKKKLLRDNFYFSKFDWYVLCRCALDGIR